MDQFLKHSIVKQLLLGIVILLSINQAGLAQKGWEAGGFLGISYYFGDLNTNYNLTRPGFSAAGIARYNFNNRVCMKFGATYGRVTADDADSDNAFEQARNLSFKSNVFDVGAQLEFNFLPYTHGSKDEFFTPYLLAGLSAFYFNPTAELDGTVYQLRELGTEGQFKGEEYYTVTGSFVYGIGFKVDLSYEWSLNFELSGRQLFTDYLDDVSTVYPDLEDLARSRGPEAAALSDRSIEIPGVDNSLLGEEGRQRGNSSTNDSVIFLSVGLVYYFGDLRCPSYSDPGRRRR